MERDALSQKFPLGSDLPEFSLIGTDSKTYSQQYFKDAKAALVVFTCNHCPYVKGSEAELYNLIAHANLSGLRALLISSNDAEQYPEDSFELMQKKHSEQKLPFPYLYDADQSVARLFDAQCTPECYLFNQTGQLVYHGALNDSPRDASKVMRRSLSTAIDQVLAGNTIVSAFEHPIGCSIKWKV